MACQEEMAFQNSLPVRTHSWHLLQNWKGHYFIDQKSEAQSQTHPVPSKHMDGVNVAKSPPSLPPSSRPDPCPRWTPWCFPVFNPAVPRWGQDLRLGKGIHFLDTLLCVREGAPFESFMGRIVWLSDRWVWILALLLTSPVTWVS